MAQRFYTACIEQAGNGFGVFFPDLPGCTSGGRTLQEAANHATEALTMHVAGMIEDKERLPEPSSPDAPLPDWLLEGGTPDVVARILVPVDVFGAVVRANITMNENLLRRVDAAAQAEGLSRSGYLAMAARERLSSASSQGSAR